MDIINDWRDLSSPLCLLQNEAMNQAKKYQLLENLDGYQKFSSSGQYIEKIFPLLQNEYNCSIRRESKRYLSALQEQEQYPLVYRVILNDDHEISREYGIRLDIKKDFDFMPSQNIDERKLWKYEHYAQYLLFKQQSQYLGAVFTQNEQGLVFSSLAIFKKSKEERFILLPYSYDSVEMLNFKNIRTKQNKLIEYRNKIIDIVHRRRQVYSLQHLWDQDLDVYFQPFCSISSYLNEKETLFQISSCPFVDLILEPSDRLNHVDRTWFAEQTEKQKQKYFANPIFLKHFDKDQICAIDDAVNFTKKITIIKGPPGTGKTQTILGICSIMQELLQPSDDQKKGVILILAKSNSVVNDLVRKIMRNSEDKNEIIFCEENKPKNIKIVRFGRPELCDSDVHCKSLEIRSQDQFFNFLFLTQKKEMFSRHITQEIIQKLKKNKRKLETFEEYQQRNQSQYFTLFALLQYIEHINIDTNNPKILNAYGNLYSSLSQFLKNNQKQYEEIEQNFLTQCNVIVSTLNSCSKQCLEEYFDKVKFRMCIVDEAPTALEPSLLIPFVKYKNMEKIVLLGDRRQLDPIVVSKDSKNYGYSRSLFERLSNHLKKNSFKLKHQYRQMENLAEITSVMFYNNSLVNGIANMQFPPYIEEKVIRNRLFFNTPSNTEEKEETSKKNDCECQAIILLVNYLLSGKQKELKNEKKITIISAYAAQRENIREKLEKQKLDKIVELDTVDSFQGKENDIIILSLVRSNQETGFLSDKKRTNVALSRAKYCQYIFGTKHTLNRNFKNWNKVIKMLQNKGEIIDYQESDLQNPNFFRDQLMPKQK